VVVRRAGMRRRRRRRRNEEDEEETGWETLCRNAGLAHSLELNPESEDLNYSRIDTSLPTTLHLASPRIRIQINS
jgi:hypothetical protein